MNTQDMDERSMTPTEKALLACIRAMEESQKAGCTDHLDCCDDDGKFWYDALEQGKAVLRRGPPKATTERTA